MKEIKNFCISVIFQQGSMLSLGVTGADQVRECGQAIATAQGIFRDRKFHRTADGTVVEGHIQGDGPVMTLCYEVGIAGDPIGFMKGYRCACLVNDEEPLDAEQAALLASLPHIRVPVREFGEAPLANLRFLPFDKRMRLALDMI